VKDRIDSEDLVESILESFASACTESTAEGQPLEEMRGLLRSITFRKFLSQIDHWSAGKRGGGRVVNETQLTGAEGESWEVVDTEAVTPQEQAMLAEAWEQTEKTVQVLKAHFAEVLRDADRLDEARRIIDLLFAGMADGVLQKTIQQEVGCTEYFLTRVVLPRLRQWLGELYPLEVASHERARQRAMTKKSTDWTPR
jgi:hypothetical protein